MLMAASTKGVITYSPAFGRCSSERVEEAEFLGRCPEGPGGARRSGNAHVAKTNFNCAYPVPLNPIERKRICHERLACHDSSNSIDGIAEQYLRREILVTPGHNAVDLHDEIRQITRPR